MLTIALSRIEFEGRHGATAVERRATRKFQVDVEVDVDGTAAERSDKLADTLDYSKMAEVIVAIGVGEPHRLLESLARRMVDNVRSRFPAIKRVRLELRKLNPPSCAGHPAHSAVRLSDE
ncbi:MAG: dihydroneopterin aldolase [Myxococcales bacterium]|jgi:dihydroneopterin aldolase|nr:dihydroneopterin aldolase [Myxococcales bacterium]